MPKKVLLTLPIPPTLNQQIELNRKNKMQAAKVKKQWDTLVSKQVQTFGVKFEKQIWIAFNWQPKTKQNDPDNLSASAKYIMDGLVLGGLIKNDNLTIIQSPILHFYNRGENTVQVMISAEPIFQVTSLQELHGFAIDSTCKI
jgi:hypothetical protein